MILVKLKTGEEVEIQEIVYEYVFNNNDILEEYANTKEYIDIDAILFEVVYVLISNDKSDKLEHILMKYLPSFNRYDRKTLLDLNMNSDSFDVIKEYIERYY